MLRIYLANLFYILAYGAFFLLPVHLRELGASNAAIGSITAAMGITNAAALYWLIFHGFRHDARRLMLAGCVFYAAGSLGMAVWDDFYVITAMRMLQGAGFCLYFIAANTWVSHRSPVELLARHIGYFGAVTLITQSFAPTLAEMIAAAVGYRALFAVTAFYLAVSALIIYTMEPSGGQEHVEEEVKEGSRSPMSPFNLLFLALAGGGLFGAVVCFSPLFLQELGIVPVSLFFIVYAVAAVAVRLVFRSLADRMGHLRVARWCFFLLALSVFWMSYSRTALAFAAASCLFGCGHGLMYPSLAAYSINAVKGGRLRGMALWAGGFAVGVSVGAWVAGGIAELYPIATMFRASLVFPLIAAFLSRPGPVAQVGGNG